MADVDQVLASLDDLLEQADALDDTTRQKIPDRTVSLWIRDLDLAYAGRLESGSLLDVVAISPDDRRNSQLRVTMDSDDFVEVVAGRLSFGSGFATGKIRVDARIRDVFELRRFL